ncbi:acyltransferase [Streptomyces durbertensis]|uniref:Acyltransferase n=1 Tax=Streptomyces durbertensis TaxID=2448886 RepID=A0ABR6EGB2_9ACTN|nr:acyltransferase [Streptomyces durbertensis]MBB1244127.1 acyltransferase [Streptomyces durbertensis]
MTAPNIPPVAERATSRLPSLTGMRFVAALLVVLSHVGMVILPRTGDSWLTGLESVVYTAGPTGVVFFFVLSGFVLTWVARPGDTRPRFWRRRLLKIYPNHLVTMGVVVVLMLLAGNAVTFNNTVPTVFLVQSWIPHQEVLLNYTSNVPTWSLACELLFYAAFPFLLPLLRRIPVDRLWHWACGTGLAIGAMPFVALLLPAQPQMPHSPLAWWREWFVYYFPLTRLLEFVLGMLVALVVLNRRWIRLPLPAAVVLALGSYLAGSYLLPEVYSQAALTAFFLALVIAATATADVERRRTGFGGRTFVFLGEISYALYIVHWLVVSYGPLGLAKPDSWMVESTVAEALWQGFWTVVISLVAAWLLYRLVELPAMRRWSRPSSAPRAPGGPKPARPAAEDTRPKAVTRV